jgi:hypothetical protein
MWQASWSSIHRKWNQNRDEWAVRGTWNVFIGQSGERSKPRGLWGAILVCVTVFCLLRCMNFHIYIIKLLMKKTFFDWYFSPWMEKFQVLSICSAHFSRLDEAVSLIQLYHIVNPEAKSVSAHFEPGLEHSFIQVNLFLIDYSDALNVLICYVLLCS